MSLESCYFLSQCECWYYDKILWYYDWYCDSLWIKISTFRNYCLLWLLTRVQAFSEFHICFALRSHIFQDGSSKACPIPISCQLTQSCTFMDKTHGLSRPHCSQLFFICQLYVMMHGVMYMYHIMATLSRYVLWEIVSLQPLKLYANRDQISICHGHDFLCVNLMNYLWVWEG